MMVGEPFCPARMRLARQRAGITLTELEKKCGISRGSLSEYENSRRTPSCKHSEQIALALDVQPEFLYQENPEEISVKAVSFRKLSKTSARSRHAVLAHAAMAVEFMQTIEERFRLPESLLPFDVGDNPAEAATLVRETWHLGDWPIRKLMHLLESKGVRILALPHDQQDIDAFCFFRDGVPFIFLNTSTSGERIRFDLAHELGHLVLHSEHDLLEESSKQREREANEFAASFLMPASAIFRQKMRGADIDRILVARRYWQVSAVSMARRLHELELLTDWQYRSLNRYLAQEGYLHREPGGMIPETSQLLRKVLFELEGKLTLSDASQNLFVSRDVVRDFVRNLVPLPVRS